MTDTANPECAAVLGGISAYLDGAASSLVIEADHTGQLEGLVRERCLRAPDGHLRRYDVRPFDPAQIWEHVMTSTGRPRIAARSSRRPM